MDIFNFLSDDQISQLALHDKIAIMLQREVFCHVIAIYSTGHIQENLNIRHMNNFDHNLNYAIHSFMAILNKT